MTLQARNAFGAFEKRVPDPRCADGVCAVKK